MPDFSRSDSWVLRDGQWITDYEAEIQDNWTDEDEAGLEEYEAAKRERIARASEY